MVRTYKKTMLAVVGVSLLSSYGYAEEQGTIESSYSADDLALRGGKAVSIGATMQRLADLVKESRNKKMTHIQDITMLAADLIKASEKVSGKSKGTARKLKELCYKILDEKNEYLKAGDSELIAQALKELEGQLGADALREVTLPNTYLNEAIAEQAKAQEVKFESARDISFDSEKVEKKAVLAKADCSSMKTVVSFAAGAGVLAAVLGLLHYTKYINIENKWGSKQQA